MTKVKIGICGETSANFFYAPFYINKLPALCKLSVGDYCFHNCSIVELQQLPKLLSFKLGDYACQYDASEVKTNMLYLQRIYNNEQN